MRAFLAIEIDDYIKDRIKETQDIIRDTNSARINYVNSENIHLTIKFFGDIDDKKQVQISNIIKETVSNYKEYKLKLVNIGAFRNINNPRVIWVGIKDDNTSVNLIKELDMKFSSIGFDKERNYTPHITIGRVKNISDKKNLTETLRKLNRQYFGKMHVTELCLKSSILTPDGPIYNTEETFKLGE